MGSTHATLRIQTNVLNSPFPQMASKLPAALNPTEEDIQLLLVSLFYIQLLLLPQALSADCLCLPFLPKKVCPMPHRYQELRQADVWLRLQA